MYMKHEEQKHNHECCHNEHEHHHGCCCHHHHESHEHHHEEHEHHHEHNLKEQIVKIIATTILLVAAWAIEHYMGLADWQLLLVYLIPYLLIGHETLKEGAEGILHGEAFNEHFLMSIATLGALLIGFLPEAENEYMEAVFVMLFFQVGELFEGYAEGKSRDSIAHLMNLRPDVAHVLIDNEQSDKAPEEVSIGSIVIIKPGEKIPLDGRIIEGQSSLNTVALTGESLPREVSVSDDVMSGCLNISGMLKVRTTKTYGESTVAKILNLVENATDQKSKSGRLHLAVLSLQQTSQYGYIELYYSLWCRAHAHL